MELIQKQLINKVVHFTTLLNNDRTTVKYERHSALFGILRNEFESLRISGNNVMNSNCYQMDFLSKVYVKSSKWPFCSKRARIV